MRRLTEKQRTNPVIATALTVMDPDWPGDLEAANVAMALAVLVSREAPWTCYPGEAALARMCGFGVKRVREGARTLLGLENALFARADVRLSGREGRPIAGYRFVPPPPVEFPALVADNTRTLPAGSAAKSSRSYRPNQGQLPVKAACPHKEDHSLHHSTETPQPPAGQGELNPRQQLYELMVHARRLGLRPLSRNRKRHYLDLLRGRIDPSDLRAELEIEAGPIAKEREIADRRAAEDRAREQEAEQDLARVAR